MCSETSACKIQAPGKYILHTYLPMKMEQCVPKRRHVKFRRRRSIYFIPTCLWRWNRQCVPKRRHIKFRRRGSIYFIPTCLWRWNSVPKRRQIKFRRRGIIYFIPTCIWRWNRRCVPKRQHVKFRRRRIAQKKAYNIQNTAKVGNQGYRGLQARLCGWIQNSFRRSSEKNK